MNLASFLDPDLIVMDLASRTKMDAAQEIVRKFVEKYPDRSEQAIMAAILEREMMGSTSFGRGFAFPHARTDEVDDMHVALGISRAGIDEPTPDGKPLYVIVVLLTPRSISKLYLQTLSALASFARGPENLRKLLEAATPQEVMDVISGTGLVVTERLTVKDIMDPDPITVGPDATLKEVANLLFAHKADSVTVVDENMAPLGEVTEVELIKAALPNYATLIKNLAELPELEPFEEMLKKEGSLKVMDVMTPPSFTVTPATLVVEAAALMLFKNVSRVPVIEDGKLVGVVFRSDIVSKIIRG